MDGERYLIVTIDTEVDKDPLGESQIRSRSGRSLVGIPEVFSPLFEEFGVIPTYLLSGEVVENPECASVLRGLGARAELGTHLHAEFLPPDRRSLSVRIWPASSPTPSNFNTRATSRRRSFAS